LAGFFVARHILYLRRLKRRRAHHQHRPFGRFFRGATHFIFKALKTPPRPPSTPALWPVFLWRDTNPPNLPYETGSPKIDLGQGPPNVCVRYCQRPESLRYALGERMVVIWR